MDRKVFVPEKYGMETCTQCDTQGYIHDPKRQPCPKCGGFGFTKKKPEQNMKSNETK
jgi:DnaJ-class molecular chaperone